MHNKPLNPHSRKFISLNHVGDTFKGKHPCRQWRVNSSQGDTHFLWLPVFSCRLGTGLPRPWSCSRHSLCTVTCIGLPTCSFLKVTPSPKDSAIVVNLRNISNVPNTHYLESANTPILPYLFQSFSHSLRPHFLSPSPGVTLFPFPGSVSSRHCPIIFVCTRVLGSTLLNDSYTVTSL